MLEMTHIVPRAARGIGAAVMALDGDWNSKIVATVESFARQAAPVERI
jgi:hypothetical protein